jgi:hypothetical protein
VRLSLSPKENSNLRLLKTLQTFLLLS